MSEKQGRRVFGIEMAGFVGVKCGVLAATYKLEGAILKFKLAALGHSVADGIIKTEQFTVLVVSKLVNTPHMLIIVDGVLVPVVRIIVNTVSAVFAVDFDVFNVARAQNI